MTLDSAAVERYLPRIQALGAEYGFTDIHVHPFEVVFGAGSYAPNGHQPGVWSTAELCYVPPRREAGGPEGGGRPGRDLPAAMQERLALLMLRRLYLHTGPRCFGDHLALGGIGRALLLPVSRPGAHSDGEMALLAAIFGGDPRFLLGYSVPRASAETEIEPLLRRAVKRWGIRAIKVHPCLSDINLGAAAGRTHLEAILAGAGRTGLPVIIHGGAYPTLVGVDAGGFALLQGLARIDFSLTDYPVVIAHAGSFGLAPAEVASRVLPLLDRLLERYPQLLVDVSALSVEVTALVLARIPPQRILFGSDALYELPWKSLVRLFAALEQVAGGRAEELLVRIAGTNSHHLLQQEDRPYDHIAAHQVLPVS